MLAYIFVPIICGIIGYFTNFLAIKMLFYPLEAHYLFGHRLPFTPGIIPKGKNRIAKSVSLVISENLMNKEVLERSLLSEDMLSKISTNFDNYISSVKAKDESLIDFLSRYFNKDRVINFKELTSSHLTDSISAKMKEPELSEELSRMVMQHVSDSLNSSILGRVMDRVFATTSLKLEATISKHLRQIFDENVDNIVCRLVGSQIEKYSSISVSKLATDYPEKLESIKQYILSSYKKTISKKLPNIIDTLNIPKIIEDRIMEMDIKETEQLLLSVIGTELRMVEILGGVLGAIIGALNLLFL